MSGFLSAPREKAPAGHSSRRGLPSASVPGDGSSVLARLRLPDLDRRAWHWSDGRGKRQRLGGTYFRYDLRITSHGLIVGASLSFSRLSALSRRLIQG